MSRSCMRTCTLSSLATILVALVAPLGGLPAIGTIVLPVRYHLPLVRDSLPLAVPGAYHEEAQPLRFEPNVGQYDPRVRFVAHGANYTLYLIAAGAVFMFSPVQAGATGRVVRWSVVGADVHARLLPEGRLPGASNYFVRRDPRDWHVGIPGYARVVERDALPGADLVYDGSAGRVVPRLLLHHGAPLTRLRVAVGIEQAGHPATMQVYHLDVGGLDSRHIVPRDVSVQFARRSHTFPTMIGMSRTTQRYRAPVNDGVGDEATHTSAPVTLPLGIIEGMLGVSGGLTSGSGIAVDRAGHIYVAGQTNAVDFPMTCYPHSRTRIAGGVAFVAKLSADGRALLWSTYLGGPRGVTANGLTTDPAGNAYVTGQTDITDFPTTPGAYARAQGTAFVAKLASDGRLVYSTLLGGKGRSNDSGEAIAVDGSGVAYVTGRANQYSSGFPTTRGAFQRAESRTGNAFVIALAPDGGHLVYSTLLGRGDVGLGIALDKGGHAYITGLVDVASGAGDIPTTSGAYVQERGTVFVSKLSRDGHSLVYSARFGGVQPLPDNVSREGDTDNQTVISIGTGIAVDGTGQAYVTGGTFAADFPTTAGAVQARQRSDAKNAAFVTKLSADGSRLVYSTLLGGVNDVASYPRVYLQDVYGDAGAAIAVDVLGNAYVVGSTNTADFPVTPHAYNNRPAQGGIFMSEFAPGGRLLYSARLGGSGGIVYTGNRTPADKLLYDDTGAGIVLDGTGHAYVTGTNQSTDAHDFPTTPGAVQSNSSLRGASTTAFVAKLAPGGGSLVFGTLLGGNKGVASS